MYKYQVFCFVFDHHSVHTSLVTEPFQVHLLTFFGTCFGMQILNYTNNLYIINLQKSHVGTSLVAQWLRIHLPMQRTRVRALVQEDPTCHGATKPVRHQLLSLRSRVREPQLLSPRAWSPCSATREATAKRSPHSATKSSPRSLQLQKAHKQQRRPNAAINK